VLPKNYIFLITTCLIQSKKVSRSNPFLNGVDEYIFSNMKIIFKAQIFH